jgi:hypothetical protein
MGKPKQTSLASQLIGFAGHHRNLDTIKARLQERDQREAADTRTEAQKWLNDPPHDRSALANRLPGKQ